MSVALASCPKKYQIGDQVVIYADCTDLNGVATYPSSCRFVIQRDKPGSAAVTYDNSQAQVTQDASITGRMLCTLPAATVAGKFDVHFYATGGVICAAQGSFTVEKDNIE